MNETMISFELGTVMPYSLVIVAILSQLFAVVFAVAAVVYRGRAAATAAEAKCLRQWLNEHLDGPRDSGWQDEALFWRRVYHPQTIESHEKAEESS
jgi:hypothetical protein